MRNAELWADTEEVFLRAYETRSDKDMSELYDNLKGYAYRVAERICYAGEIEDTAHVLTTFVLRYLPRFDPKLGPPQAFITRIFSSKAANCRRGHVRMHRRRERSEKWASEFAMDHNSQREVDDFYEGIFARDEQEQ